MLGLLNGIDRKTKQFDRWLPAEALDIGPLWKPLPGPQTLAYESSADELYYGGAAGGGKTDLLLGVAITQHRKSIIFRREYPQLKDIVLRSEVLLGELARFNAQANMWRAIPGGRILEFGAVQYEKDVRKYKGRPHDFYGFDELTEFTERQYRFLIGWARTTERGQRVRVLNTGNPPTHAEGEWVIRYWGPWLDDQHPNPAEPGELRWFAVIDGEDTEVESDVPIEHKGESIHPKSRSFIPARLEDNPYLANTDYRTVLQNLPEPLRSQLLYGDFNVGSEDDPWQVIPTEWVRLAQERWKDRAPDGPMTALGVDVARGGDDQTVLAPRYGAYFGPLQKHAGSSTPDGPLVASLALGIVKDEAVINVDVIGIGSSVFDTLASQDVNVAGVNFSERSEATDKSGRLRFRNKRAEAYWRMREALDPDYGDQVALPPDNELLADLVAPHWKLSTSGIQVESKEDIIKRLGRSPDCGDAVVLANFVESPRWRDITFLSV